MCGIAGIWGSGIGEAAVADMMSKLVHRGPDAKGMYRGDAGVLGHRRLSIMDPVGGDQPIYTEDRSHVIVANGEIYNFKPLRRELDARHSFTTTSDSEAALHMYEELGPRIVDSLDGMYAFVITDGEHLFAARDAIGIKPLYYAESDGRFWFSSEVEPLTAHVESVNEFPPGSYYDSRTGFHRFYSVPDIEPQDRSVDYFLPVLRSTVEGAVIKRLMSDVPLGAFLSGGLDSSIIAAVARQNTEGPFHTFSVGVENSPDLAAARLVSRHLDTTHHEYVLTVEEVMAKLPEIIRALESYDRDLVRSAIPCYFTSRLAAEYVKVILTGEGADELFAGYTYYNDLHNMDETLHRELRRSVAALHNVNLQRVDRLTMWHSIEGRVPFLDLEMIELGQRIPARLKLYGDNPVEKWILRKAFEDLLPNEIVWRKKAQFDEGSGMVDVLEDALRNVMAPDEAEEYMARYPEAELRCAEECHYHRIFMDVLEHPARTLSTVGRWADRPDMGTE